jgi:hypothetical protein
VIGLGDNSDEDTDPSPFQLRTRTITGAKTYSLKKTTDPVKDSGLSTIHNPVIGRPIWRTTRESVFKTLNQVGGGLGDHIVNEAIDDKTALKAIDGFGEPVGYDLDNIE